MGFRILSSTLQPNARKKDSGKDISWSLHRALTLSMRNAKDFKTNHNITGGYLTRKRQFTKHGHQSFYINNFFFLCLLFLCLLSSRLKQSLLSNPLCFNEVGLAYATICCLAVPAFCINLCFHKKRG